MKKNFAFISLLISIFTLGAFAQRGFVIPESKYQSKAVRKAEKKWRNNDTAEAFKILDKTIAEGEDLLEAFQFRSFLHRLDRDFGKAIADLDKILELKSDDAESYAKRASYKIISTNDFNGALKDLESAKKYEPDSMRFYVETARIKESLRNYDEAIAEYQAALKINPEAITIQRDLSGLYMGLGKSDEAIAGLQNFLDSYSQKRDGKLPKIRGVRVKKGNASMTFTNKNGEKESVPILKHTQADFNVNSYAELREKETEMETAGNLASAFVLLGGFYIKEGAIEKAFANLNTALEINKNQENAYILRGTLYLNKGEIEKAIEDFDEAIDIIDLPLLYLNRGIAHKINGDEKKAQKDFDKYLKLFPDGKAELDKRIEEAKQKMPHN